MRTEYFVAQSSIGVVWKNRELKDQLWPQKMDLVLTEPHLEIEDLIDKIFERTLGNE